MNKAFEKILERLEERKQLHERMISYEHENGTITEEYQARKAVDVLNYAKKIVQEVAEEYNGGWIACSERLPSELDFVLYTHKDGEVDICSIEYFYDYLDKFTAWQPLPEPYQPKGE